MRTNLIGTFLVLLFSVPLVRAQDVVKVAPKNATLLLENDRVRVIRVVLKAGEKLAMHSHRGNNIVYVLTGGKTKFTSPDGKVTEREIKTGEAIWTDPGTHTTENAGTGEIRTLEVELKK